MRLFQHTGRGVGMAAVTMALALALGACALVVPAGTGDGTPLTNLPTIVVRIGDDEFTAELTRTLEEQRTGLMFRRPEDFPPDRAMLFGFDPPTVVSVINTNVLFDIDVAFIRADRTIVQIIRLTAGDPIPRWSREPVALFMEVNAGELSRRGIAVGDTVEFATGRE